MIVFDNKSNRINKVNIAGAENKTIYQISGLVDSSVFVFVLTKVFSYANSHSHDKKLNDWTLIKVHHLTRKSRLMLESDKSE